MMLAFRHVEQSCTAVKPYFALQSGSAYIVCTKSALGNIRPWVRLNYDIEIIK